MTLEQLRIFVAVAEREHVTAAARDLNLTQSAVSNAIAALEGRHGIRLFDRVGRGIVLNAAGQTFLSEARAILERVAVAEQTLVDLSGLGRGRLSVSASKTIASYWLPPRLVTFQLAYPGVEIDVAIRNTHDTAKAVSEGRAEIGLVEGRVIDPALTQTDIGHDQLMILVGPDHPWARLKVLLPRQLSHANWVMREEGSGTRSTFEEAVAAAGVDPASLPIRLVLPSSEAALAAIETGHLATVMSRTIAAAALEAGRVCEASYALPERPLRLLRHASRYQSRAGDAFMRHLAQGEA